MPRVKDCVGVGMSNRFCAECEFVDNFGGEVVVDIRGLINELVVWLAGYDIFC